MNTSRQPQRTCIACRQVRDKNRLVRLVCNGSEIELDLSGKKPGRGAYLCRAKACWDSGVKSGRIEYSLRAALTPQNKEHLLKNLESLEGTTKGDK